LFPKLLAKPAVMAFTSPALSSDGGLLLLKAADTKVGLTRALAGCFKDSRQAGKVFHTFQDFLAARICGFAAGYSDGNDFTHLRHDAVWSKVCGKPVPSQPTVSRFENALGSETLDAMNLCLAQTVFRAVKAKRGKKPVRSIILDMDGTDDPTHGQQELALFNAFYDQHGYMPLLAFATFDGRNEQYLVASKLRPGNASPAEGGVEMLDEVLKKCRHHFPKARIKVRLDAGFSTPQMLDFLDAARVKYFVSFAKNANLLKQAEFAMGMVRKASKESGESERAYGACVYQTAKTWPHPRRVVYKAEFLCHEGMLEKENQRFVVTNSSMDPEKAYTFYCGRGDSENRIKELKLDLNSGRTSCQDFQANRFRLLLASAAFVLLQFMRSQISSPVAQDWQAGTLRLRVIKVAVMLQESVRRLIFTFAKDFPGKDVFLGLAASLGAV
jgi:hypothetical protein